MKHLRSLAVLAAVALTSCGEAPLVPGARPGDLSLLRLPAMQRPHGEHGATYEVRSDRGGELFVQLRSHDKQPRADWNQQKTPTEKLAPSFRSTQGEQIDSTLQFRILPHNPDAEGEDGRVLLTIDPVSEQDGKLDRYEAQIQLYGPRLTQSTWAEHTVLTTSEQQLSSWQDHAVLAPGERTTLGFRAQLPPIDREAMKVDMSTFPMTIRLPDTKDGQPCQVTVIEIGWIPDAN